MTALATHPHAGDKPGLDLALPGEGRIILNTEKMRGTQKSLAELAQAVDHYPEKVKELTLSAQAFLVEHCGGDVARLRGLAIEKLKVNLSQSYFSNWLKGQYFTGGATNVSGEGLTRWTSFCEALREHDRVTTTASKLGFIETGTTRAIHNHVRDVMDPQNPCRFGAICGPTGSQKTAGLTLTSIKLGFPKAVRFECTTSMGLYTFARKWVNLYNGKLGGPGSKGPVLLESLMSQQHPDNLVIIHNIQRAVQGNRDKEPIIEFLIEAQEDKKFPLVLEFKQDWWVGMTKIEKAYFEQVIGRFGGEANILQLPDYTPVGDLRAIALANNIESSTAVEMFGDWCRLPGRIRNVFRRLYHAKKWARLDGKDRITLKYLEDAANYVPPATVDDDEGGAS